MSKPSFVYVTYINATPQAIWDALRDPAMTKQYWFARQNISDWKVGSRWEHQRCEDPSKVDVAGKVIESNPPHKLVFSWVDPADEGKPEKTSRVTYELTPANNSTCLTVRHEELEPDSKMFKGISQGWPAVLSNLKTFLETGKAMDMNKTCG